MELRPGLPMGALLPGPLTAVPANGVLDSSENIDSGTVLLKTIGICFTH